MAEPKRKHSKARRDTRRNSHWKMSLPSIIKCPQCGAAATGNFCPECGTKKPAAQPDGWVCSCGAVNKGRF